MSDATLLDRPIEGERSWYGAKEVKEQFDEQRFLELLDAVLAHPQVDSVRWHQYTPYFNDGEACIFNVYGVYVKLVDGDDEAGDYEDGYVDEYTIRPEGDWEGKWPERKFVVREGQDTSLWGVYSAFENPVEGGNFDNVLLKYFGDPAQVTATKEGFEVEYYDHD